MLCLLCNTPLTTLDSFALEDQVCNVCVKEAVSKVLAAFRGRNGTSHDLPEKFLEQ